MYLIRLKDNQGQVVYIADYSGPDLRMTPERDKAKWYHTLLDTQVDKTYIADHHAPEIIEAGTSAVVS